SLRSFRAGRCLAAVMERRRAPTRGLGGVGDLRFELTAESYIETFFTAREFPAVRVVPRFPDEGEVVDARLPHADVDLSAVTEQPEFRDDEDGHEPPPGARPLGEVRWRHGR